MAGEDESDSAQQVFTQSQFDRWMTVQQAVDLVGKEQGRETAIRTIAKRLATDQIKARAERLFVNEKPYTKILVLIRTDVWKELAGEDYLTMNSFWRTGDVEVMVPDPQDYRSRGIKFELFTVRFEPAGIHKIIAKPKPPFPTAAEAYAAQTKMIVDSVLQEQEQEPKGPPVSPAALKAWYAAYKTAFVGTEDTEAKALESVKGCFPGKSVSRDAVRALRGDQKRGPKPKTAK